MVDEGDPISESVEREANRRAEVWRKKLEKKLRPDLPSGGRFMKPDPENRGYVRATRAEFIARSVEKARETYRFQEASRRQNLKSRQISSPAPVDHEDTRTPGEIAQALKGQLNSGGKA